jgi:hypothetical protein
MINTLHFLLDDGLNANAWGDSLKMLVSILVLFLVAIGVFIWWIKRG